LIVSAVVELVALAVIVYGAINISYSTVQVEETAKQIAEMANRNERMTQSILKKVYNVSSPQA
jgi:cell division protein FtsB